MAHAEYSAPVSRLPRLFAAEALVESSSLPGIRPRYLTGFGVFFFGSIGGLFEKVGILDIGECFICGKVGPTDSDVGLQKMGQL